MIDTEENVLRDNQLASIAKMLAGYTHELKNHLAIINESSGLMGDLLEMGGGDNDQSLPRFKKIISAIGERVSLANSMAKHLNRFAHRMDQPDAVFDVNDLLIEGLAFLERFSRLKRISLQHKLQPDLPAVHNNPSLLQFVFFTLVQRIIDQMESGGEIIFSTVRKGQNILISVDVRGISAPASDLQSSLATPPSLQYAAQKMGVVLTSDSLVADQHMITITIPSVEK